MSRNVLYIPPSCPVKTEGKDLLKAAWLGRLRLARLLVDGGTDVNIQNADGQTALLIALVADYTDETCCEQETIVKYLLEKGANVNTRDCTGSTALMYACKRQLSLRVIRILLDFSADPVIKDHTGQSALHHAANAKYHTALRMLAKVCKVLGKDIIIIETERNDHDNISNQQNTGKNSPLLFRETLPRQCIKPDAPDSGLERSVGSRDTRINKQLLDIPHTDSCENTSGVSSPRSQSPSYVFGARLGLQTKSRNSKIGGLHNDEIEARIQQPAARLGRRGSLPATLISGDINLPSIRPDKKFNKSAETLTEESILSLSLNNNAVVSNRQRVIGPGGRMLERQGSGRQLCDMISHMRPGMLPPININLKPPIPDIPTRMSPMYDIINSGPQSPNIKEESGYEDGDEDEASPPFSPQHSKLNRRLSLQDCLLTHSQQRLNVRQLQQKLKMCTIEDD